MIKAVIFDWGYTIYDHENHRIFPDALKLLEDLKAKGIILILVSRATDIDKRWKDFKELQMYNYFSELDVVPTESSKEFKFILKKVKANSKETMVIGDRVKSEILEGNKIGCVTVWIRQGKFANEFASKDLEKPDYTITYFEEVLPLLEII